MRINHNISGLNTLNKMQENNQKINKSLQKLSSGMRINQAADDSAGLSISEKMKAQIRGLEQAERNIKDGISLVDTAEAGLGEIANPNLIRLRELAVQAANDTLTNNDRVQIQKEVEQIKQGINHIAHHTEFNKTPLLRVPDEGIKVEEVASTEQIVTVNPGQIVTAGYVIIPEPADPNTFEVEGFFGTISTGVWPDVNIVSPNGEKFGYQEEFISGSGEQEDTTNQSSSRVWYTGYGADDEKMIFENPISGKWLIEIRNTGGNQKSTFMVKSNYLIHTNESDTAVTREIPGNLKIQVGPNQMETLAIDLSDVRISELGIDQLNLTTRNGAEEAIALVDKAMEITTKERTKFGSYRNALEHTLNNALNYKENIMQAESRLRDLNVASEVSELAAYQILLQSSETMLAQSNNAQQSIIEFLK